jgi:hypothetical protein
MREHRGRHRAVGERRPAGQRREQHAAERVHVGAGVGAAAAQLLRRAVLDGPDPLARLGQARVRARQPREPEVTQIGVRAGQQHVGGFDVAVHEPGPVRGVQCRPHLGDHVGRQRRRQRAALAQQRVQVGPADVAHHQVQRPVVLAGRVDRDHVRMVDRRGHPRLSLEPLAEALVAGAVRRQQLQRDRPAEAQLGGAVDHAHAAAAGDRFDAAAGELGTWFELGHARIVTRGGRGSVCSRFFMDLGDPISYLVLAEGTAVLSSDGERLGTVEHVLAVADADVFDGVIVDMRAGPGGHRFADASQIDRIYERGVVLALDQDAAGRLPEPSENPAAMDADPDDVTPDGLDDKLRRAWDYLSGNY